MDLALPLDKMTIAEKLGAMEQIWDDLCRTPEDVPSPEWHGEVLGNREKMIEEGSARFSDWSEAKRRIRDRTE